MTVAYRFGSFELKPATRQLLVEGEPAGLGARAFDVLLALVERHERLVGKAELLDLAWPGVVVEENNLQVQISSLRKILGDGIIETVPGKGYRFKAVAIAFEPSAQGVSETPRHNLPQPLTRFVGHEADLEEYRKVVVGNRLVTLTGVGGCGKTRLAIEIASRLPPTFADGAWFVDLAPVSDPERLPLTVARALELTERPDQQIVETLCEHLAGRRMLLVLDNCEHLVGACSELVTTMLGRANQLHVLATSREALAVPGERTLRVRSLSCPPLDRDDGPRRFETFEAIQLFVDRARLIQPEFALDSGAVLAVAEICCRLDGIPLAIELAAARTKVLSITELREKLDDRFRLLVGGSRTALPRQQTLLATIKWSFDLLTPAERRFLERLSVFAGGWTLEGAVAVAEEHAEQFAVLELLTRLIDKSLIGAGRSDSGRTRYSMLETVRQFGLEALATAGDADVTTKRHLEYFVALAERLEPAIGMEDREALEQLAPELDNLVQALGSCERLSGGAELGLRLVAALNQYWPALGLMQLGFRLTTEVLAAPGAEGSRTRARALYVATRLAHFLGRHDETRLHGDECLALARQLRDERLAAGTLSILSADPRERGDIGRAIAISDEALRLARACGDTKMVSRALNNFGEVYRTVGNLEAARPFFEEGLQGARECGDAHATAIIASNLAKAYLSRGQAAPAFPLAVEALEVAGKAPSKWTLREVLEVIVGLAVAGKDWHTAARVLGYVEALVNLLGLARWRGDAEFIASAATAISNALSEADFIAAFDAGQTLSLEEATHEALAWLKKSAATAPSVVVEFRRRKPSAVG